MVVQVSKTYIWEEIEMSTWIKLLPLELDSIEESSIIEPDVEPEVDDRIVGVMPLTAKKLYTLSKLLEKEADTSILARKYCANKDAKFGLESRVHQYSAKAQFCKMALWISLRDEFELWHENIRVCTGFRVVTYDEREDDIHGRFFRLG